jgi:beta-1,4-N-acetylglucosaminyltransferase
MIFVTIGTSEPFDRLLRALPKIDDEELIVQGGGSTSRPDRARWVEYVSFDELVELVRAARVVVTHAGVGTIMVALANGKHPVVVPRLKRFGEAVDDHQLELARRLDSAGYVTLVEDEADLPAALGDGEARAPGDGSANGQLARELRALIAARLAADKSPEICS